MNKLPTYFKKKNLKSHSPHNMLSNGSALKEVQRIIKKSAKLPISEYLKQIKDLSTKYSDEIYLQTKYAAILGDWGQTLSLSEERKAKKKAVVILSKLLKRLRGTPYPLKCYVRNEYYYHSGQYLKQYQLGVERLKKGHNGHFSAGVGASLYAYELYQKGQNKRALKYVLLSFRHWQYFKSPEATGGIFFAISLAFIKGPQEAKRAFQKTIKTDAYSNTFHKLYYEREKRRLDTLCALIMSN